MSYSKYKFLSLLILIILGISSNTNAKKASFLEFDIYKKSDSLVVLIELDDLLSEPVINQLNDGIDHIFDITITLYRPKKLWGESKIAQQKQRYRISYQIITKEYSSISYSSNDSTVINFSSILKLFEHLNQSIEITTVDLDSLETHREYFVDIHIDMVSMTSFNVNSDTQVSGENSSPVSYFFEKFLEFTNFGREEFETRSRDFLLKELYNK